MNLIQLNCPNCGAPAPQHVTPKQPFRCTACGSVLIMASTGKPLSIVCPQCQTVNSSFHEYCAVCGTKLLVVCPICYLPNSVEAVICERCGVNIQEELQRRETWMDLKKMHDRKRKDALVQALEDEQRIELQRLLAELDEPERHAFAIFYLCQHGEAALEPLLETLQTDPDPDARYGAARALGMLGDDRATPTLIEALSDPEPAVRYWAVDALVTLEATSSSEAIRGLSRDPFKWVQERAKKALRELE
jgi:HEAT repeat protein/phage FluMu protein Com